VVEQSIQCCHGNNNILVQYLFPSELRNDWLLPQSQDGIWFFWGVGEGGGLTQWTWLSMTIHLAPEFNSIQLFNFPYEVILSIAGCMEDSFWRQPETSQKQRKTALINWHDKLRLKLPCLWIDKSRMGIFLGISFALQLLVVMVCPDLQWDRCLYVHMTATVSSQKNGL
jgi:hypothetical protein